MTADDVRLTAQLVVDGRVHCVSDAAVEALARRVLELEGERLSWALSVKTGEVHEREACARLCDDDANDREASDSWREAARTLASVIRARGAK